MNAAILALILLSGEDVDFPNDVLPHLTRIGCNAGTCHGAATGQNGFKLSLLGYDARRDWLAITRELRGRRIDRAEPARSLILRKPVKELRHGGGRVMEKDSESYRALLGWLEAGAPWRSAKPVELVRIAARVGRVTAHYSDGSTRDVTRLALFSSNDDAIASDDGTVKSSGETSIMVRYGGRVAAIRVGKPYGPRTPVPARRNLVDDPINAKISAYGLSAAAPCDDATFLRRATLDAQGRLPTPPEVRGFDGNRNALIDRLLGAPEFESHWSTLWSGILDARSDPFKRWVRDRIGKPYDETVRQLIADEPHLYLAIKDPKELSEKVGQAFLGARWMCAQCHNHPFKRFTRRNYYEMASFFARVRVRDGRVEMESRGELELEGKPVPPPFGTSPDRRHDLADWVVRQEAFAEAAVNRVWDFLMGRGLVEPVDDLRVSNPPTHPELLGGLAAEFRKDHSIRRLVGLVMKSAAYGRATGKGGAFYDSRKAKPLDPGVLGNVIRQSTGGGPAEMPAGPSLASTLHLMNGDWLNGGLRADPVEALYLGTLSRFPTAAERAHWTGRDPDYLKDLHWALLNSKEFGTNH